MKMDGRDNAECQNWEMRDKIGIIKIVKLDNKTKKVNSSHLLKFKRGENVKSGRK